jgi:hypothetical protein
VSRGQRNGSLRPSLVQNVHWVHKELSSAFIVQICHFQNTHIIQGTKHVNTCFSRDVAEPLVKHAQTSGGDTNIHKILRGPWTTGSAVTEQTFEVAWQLIATASLRLFLGKVNQGPLWTSCNLITSLWIALCLKKRNKSRIYQTTYTTFHVDKLETRQITFLTLMCQMLLGHGPSANAFHLYTFYHQ